MWPRLLRWLRRRPAPGPLVIYCDGSADDRGGRPGAWAFCVVQDEVERLRQCGSAPRTTNVLMELEAALAGLEAVHARGWHQAGPVELVSDSRIALEAAAGRAFPGKHRALAEAVHQACARIGATPRWVRSHSGHRWNEAVDALAREARLAQAPLRRRRGPRAP